MEAAIGFDIYKDFSKYLVDGLGVDYSKAMEELNKYVKELVDNGNLVITYDGKPTEIILPIEEVNCGNIFGEDNDGFPLWNSVEIWCKFPYVKPEDFISDELNVEICPACWSPEHVVW